MDIMAICALAVVSAVMALLLRHRSPQTALLISIGAGVVILLTFIRQIVLTADDIRLILEAGGVSSGDVMILLKTLGICFITEFTCDTVTEAGMLSLATNLSFAGKLTVLITALPLFRELIGLVSAMVNGS
jgi:stage III sporulation protein AD